jgi:hypothetical protein
VSLQELLVYFYDCKKKEKEKLSQCVIATRGNVRLQKINLTLSVWLKKETRLFRI